MTPLRVGIVGCGEVTQIIHLPTLYQLNDLFQVTALCDVSPGVLETVASTWRVAKRFYDYQQLIERDDVDAVLIANPNAYHAEVTLAAVASGKHVMIEKPMCMTLREADEIITATQAHPEVIVQVGYMRRYAPAFLEACKLVSQMGTIHLARVHDVLGHNHLIISGTSRVVRATDIPLDVSAAGQALNDALITEAISEVGPEVRRAYSLMLGLSSHDISAMREMLGTPRRVLQAAQRCGGMYLTATFDYGDYICHYETGVDNIPRFDAALEVYGENQVVRVQYDTPYVRNLPIRLFVTEANGRGGVVERNEHPAWGDAFVAEWQAFHVNVTRQTVPKTSAMDFRQDLELFQSMIGFMKA